MDDPHHTLPHQNLGTQWPLKVYIIKKSRYLVHTPRRVPLSDGIHFRYDFSKPVLKCVTRQQAEHVMKEILKGICGSHVRGRVQSQKVSRAGYYWTLKEECMNFTGSMIRVRNVQIGIMHQLRSYTLSPPCGLSTHEK